MIQKHGHPPLRRLSAPHVLETSRYDGLNHWPAFISEETTGGTHKRKMCKLCYEVEKKNSKVATKCEKCNVALHIPECFKKYHTQ